MMSGNDCGTKLGSASWKRLCKVLWVTLITLEILAILLYHDAMYSPFNAHSQPKRDFHAAALSEGRAYASTLPSKNQTIPGGSLREGVPASPELAIVVLTSKRREAYLDACLWSLLEHNSPGSFASTTLTLLNTARPPDANTEAAHWRRIFSSSEWDRPLPAQVVVGAASSPDAAASWARRGVSDYAQALEECAGQRAAWCLILEEDAVPRRDFLSAFRRVVRDPLKRQRNVGMVKVFVSDHWDGFSYSWDHARDVALVAIFALLFVLGIFRFCLPPAPVARRRENGGWCKFFSAHVLCAIGFYIIWRSMGRQALLNLIECPGWVHLDPILHETAGTVGIAFPAAALPHVRDYLVQGLASGQALPPIDVALNLWVASSSFRALRTRPSLVQHIGAYSSAGYKNQGDFEMMKQDSGFTF